MSSCVYLTVDREGGEAGIETVAEKSQEARHNTNRATGEMDRQMVFLKGRHYTAVKVKW